MLFSLSLQARTLFENENTTVTQDAFRGDTGHDVLMTLSYILTSVTCVVSFLLLLKTAKLLQEENYYAAILSCLGSIVVSLTPEISELFINFH